MFKSINTLDLSSISDIYLLVIGPGNIPKHINIVNMSIDLFWNYEYFVNLRKMVNISKYFNKNYLIYTTPLIFASLSGNNDLSQRETRYVNGQTD